MSANTAKLVYRFTQTKCMHAQQPCQFGTDCTFCKGTLIVRAVRGNLLSVWPVVVSAMEGVGSAEEIIEEGTDLDLGKRPSRYETPSCTSDFVFKTIHNTTTTSSHRVLCLCAPCSKTCASFLAEISVRSP